MTFPQDVLNDFLNTELLLKELPHLLHWKNGNRETFIFGDVVDNGHYLRLFINNDSLLYVYLIHPPIVHIVLDPHTSLRYISQQLKTYIMSPSSYPEGILPFSGIASH